MKNIFLLAGFIAILINNPLYACEIVNKREVKSGGLIGVAGNCSNNGGKVECYNLGAFSGGLTCDGPNGTYSGYYLQDIIKSVCGCLPQDQKRLEGQIEQELSQ